MCLKRRKLGIGRYRPPGCRDPRWTEAELALLGTAPDKEIARCIGRTWAAVYGKRWELVIAQYRQPRCTQPVWTEEEMALLGTAPDEEIARQIGRTTWAVRRGRREGGIPKPDDRRRGEFRR